MSLCQYKNILGEPKKGFHSSRFLGFARNDIIATIIAAYLFHIYYKTSFLYTLFILFCLGILLHELFCVKTTFNTLLFHS